MSVVGEAVLAVFEGIALLAGIKRDPCRVLARKQLALARARSRKRPSARRIRRLRAEIAVWEKRCAAATATTRQS